MRLTKTKKTYSASNKWLHFMWGHALFFFILTGCNPAQVTKSGTRSSFGATYENSAYVFRESPSVIAGGSYGLPVDIAKFVSGEAAFITSKTQLKTDCSITFESNLIFPTLNTRTETDCIDSRSVKDPSEVALTKQADGSWSFPIGSDEFYQVNTLYHINLAKQKFLGKIGKAMTKLHTSYSGLDPRSALNNQQKQIPLYLKDSNLFWFKAITPTLDSYFKYNYLTSYSNCSLDRNASFSPAGPELCFGKDATKPSLKFAQDPSVVYHELGHAFVSLMMNYRNGTTSSSYTTLRSNLGQLYYDEAGAINEGLADYFSYMVNGRTHMGEWALGRFFKASRPLSENDPMHIEGVDTTPEGRLSYPQFLHYDPNYPTLPAEVIHYAGQITSHYLVALTEELKTACYANSAVDEQHDSATDIVVGVIAETLSEIGDLRAVGLDTSSGTAINTTAGYFNNLDPESSFVWTHVMNPTNYRRFYQIFAKNLNKMLKGYPECASYSSTNVEKLLDDYGLLLFKTYNNDLDSTTFNNDDASYVPLNSYLSRTLTPVASANRRKTVLVSKSLVSLASGTETGRPVAYIVDSRTSINAILSALLFKGTPVQPTTGLAGTEYNNGNSKISPGEIVGVIPNILNSSNSTIAGVQVLANDWDHVKFDAATLGSTTSIKFNPCIFSGDDLTVDQGGLSCTSTLKTYKKAVSSVVASAPYAGQAVAPVCYVQYTEAGSTKWVSQNEFRIKSTGLNLMDKDCLGYTANYASTNPDLGFNPHSCLVRFLPGGDHAVMSKIEPQKTFSETLASTTGATPKFNSSSALLMEVNKWVQPGTKFRCRLRVRFTNCDDCYHDSARANDDYLDHEYNGAKPYKIINFDFEVRE